MTKIVMAEHVSKKADNKTLCRPPDGYKTGTEVDLTGYVEVETINGELTDCDQKFPKSAPLTDHVKVGNKIYKKT